MLSVNGRCFTFDMSADARNSLWIRNRGWHTGTYRDHSGYPRHGGFLSHGATSYQLSFIIQSSIYRWDFSMKPTSRDPGIPLWDGPDSQDGFERGEGSSCFLARSEESVPRDALATVIGACLNQDGRLGPETFTGNMRNLMCLQWWWC